jgi:hypothetical protein
MPFPLSRSPPEVTPPLSSSEVGAQQKRSPDEESVGKPARGPAPVRRHPLLSPAGRGSSTGRIRTCRGACCSATSSPIAMMTAGRKRQRNEGRRRIQWVAAKKDASSQSAPAIGRFNWHPNRHRPVMEFLSFAVPTSVDARTAPSRSPTLCKSYRKSLLRPIHLRRQFQK